MSFIKSVFVLFVCCLLVNAENFYSDLPVIRTFLNTKLDQFKIKFNHELNLKKFNKAGISQDTPFRSILTNRTEEDSFKDSFPENVTFIRRTTSDGSSKILALQKGKNAVYNYDSDSGSNTFTYWNSLPEFHDNVVDADITEKNDSIFVAVLLTNEEHFYARIIEVQNDTTIHHHDIGFKGFAVSGMKFGASNGELFLVFIFSRNVFQKTSFTHFEVFHWGDVHFNPVIGNYHTRVTTNGAKALQVWDHYGSLKIAILDNNHLASNSSKILVLNLKITHYAKHPSKFEINQNEVIQLPFVGTELTFFEDVSKNLVVCSSEQSKGPIFRVYSMLPRSKYFIYNDLLTPKVSGRGDHIWRIEAPFPDVTILVHDSINGELTFFNQDLELRFDISKVFRLSDLVDMALIPISSEYDRYKFLSMANSAHGIKYHLNTVEYAPIPKLKDVLIECIKEVKNFVEDRQENITYLHENIGNVFVTNKDQKVNTSIIITGNLFVKENLKIHRLTITTNKTDWSNVTNSILLEDILDTQEELQMAKESAGKVVYKSKPQIINGSINFLEDIFAEHGKIDRISNEVILNGENISRLFDNTLKLTKAQTLTNVITLHNLTVEDNLNVKERLNSRNVNNILQTNRTQVISGHYTIDNNVKFDVVVVDTLNDIAPEYLVLTSGFQEIDGLKTFKTVNVTNIYVDETTNGIDLSHFASKVLSLEKNHQITGNYKIENLYVDGDIDIQGLISGTINITDLALNTVDITSMQEISGCVEFLHKLHVSGNLTSSLVNDIDTKELITLNTKQLISGELMFKSKARLLKDLKVDRVNKIPTSDWVLKDEAFNITAHKIFNQSIHINGDIIMDPLVTIDSVDPSKFNLTVVPRSGFVEFLGATTIEKMDVMGGIIFQDEVNEYNISEIEDQFWKKSIHQVIPVPVVAPKNTVFRGNVTASEGVNGYNLEDDYVHTFGNESIGGHIQFKANVLVDGDIVIEADKTFNGYDISELSEYVVRKDGPPQQINGLVYFSNLNVIDGDVVVNSTINGFDISKDFMDTFSNQTVTTPLNIISNTTTVFDISAKVVNISDNGTVDGIDLSEYAKTVVLINETRVKLIKDKVFHKIIVNELDVSGSINGVDINYFFENAVTLSTFQKVGGKKTFNSHVDFEKKVSLRHLNDIEFRTHIRRVINRHEDTFINGKLTIEGSVYVNGSINIVPGGEVNEIDVSTFGERVMVHNKLQTVTGLIWFNSNLTTIDNLKVEHGTLDGVPLDKIALTTRKTSLNGHLTFSNLTINGNLTIKGLTYGCDLYDIYTNAVFLHGRDTQTIYGSKIINELVVKQSGDIILLPNKTVGGADLSEVQKTVLVNIGSQNLTGNFTFLKNIFVENLDLTFLNGQNVTDIFSDLVFINESNQTIEGLKIFSNDVHSSSVKVKGNISVEDTVNNVDLNQLLNQVVFPGANASIFGKKVFEHINASEIYIAGLLNGIDISHDLWLTNTSDVLPGETKFKSHISVEDLTVHGLIDRVNLTQVVDGRVTLSSNQTLEVPLMFTDVKVEGDCKVKESVNEIDPDDIVKKIGDFTITGAKIFNETVHLKSDIELDLINGIDIKELSDTVVRNHLYSVISAETIFENLVHLQDDVNINGTVDSIDISEGTQAYFEMKETIYKSLDDLLSRTVQQHNYTEEAIELSHGQTVIPSHLEKVERKDFRAYQFYPKDSATSFDGNVDNPSTFYGFVDGEGCLSDCSCSTTCEYSLEESTIIETSCKNRKIFRVCDEDECYEISSSKLSASTDCPTGSWNGLLEGGGIMENLNIPTVTDVELVPSYFGPYFLISSPSDGVDAHNVKIYRKVGNTLEAHTDLYDSFYVKQMHKFIKDIQGILRTFIVAITDDKIQLYYYNEDDDDFELLDTYRTKTIPTGILTLRNIFNETLVVVSCVIDDMGHLMQEEAPNIFVFKIIKEKFSIVDEVFSGSVYHISHMQYAGDTYVVASQTVDDRISLYRLQGDKLKNTNQNIQITNPTSTLPSYYSIRKPFYETNTTDVTNFITNEFFLFVLSSDGLSTLKTVQFGNGINLVTASP